LRKREDYYAGSDDDNANALIPPCKEVVERLGY
jgi:ABC-type antimicrobial peptide transport system permease subunit